MSIQGLMQLCRNAVASATVLAALSGCAADVGDDETELASQTEALSSWRRTVVLMYGPTQVGQDMFLRGGIDHDFANHTLGRNCTTTNTECAIPIRHRSTLNNTTREWKTSDDFLDWYGREAGQLGTGVEGSPLDWTTNRWPAEWGQKRTVAVDGYGEEPLNTYGHHYWLLDVDMDCSKTVNGWFELKSFISNGPGWEGDVSQASTPYRSRNHFAQCGKVNVFWRGSSDAQIRDFASPSLVWAGNATALISRGAAEDACDNGTDPNSPVLPTSLIYDSWVATRAIAQNVCFQVYKRGVTDWRNPNVEDQVDVRVMVRFDGQSEFHPARFLFKDFVGNNARYRVPLAAISPFSPYDCPTVPYTVDQYGGLQTGADFYFEIDNLELKAPTASGYYRIEFREGLKPADFDTRCKN